MKRKTRFTKEERLGSNSPDESQDRDPTIEQSRERWSRREALQMGAVGAGAVLVGSTYPAYANAALRPKSAGSSAMKPYDPNAPGGPAPKLPKRLAYPLPSNAALFLAVEKYMQQACDDRGLGLLTSDFNLDPETQTTQTSEFFQRGIGGLFETPLNIPSSNPQLKQAAKLGAMVSAVQRPYCHLQISINQYDLGYRQGVAAVEWVKQHLGGKAQVVIFNDDESQSLIPRHTGQLAGLKTGGSGITIVTDVTAPETNEIAANDMTTILQAHPGVNVVLGDAPVIEGVFAAFQSLGRATDKTVYLSGNSGTDPDYKLIRDGTIYRATSGEPWNIWAYCIGQFTADWLEGGSIPRGMSAVGGSEKILTGAAEVAVFQKGNDNPRGLWKNHKELKQYVTFFGNISYAKRRELWQTEWTP
jgi:ribose transport system substrate-binding protein